MKKHNFGMSYLEISGIQTINPETAAHNIASAYINSAFKNAGFQTEDSVDFSLAGQLSQTYEYAYNYAYNYIAHQNKIIDEAE